MEFRMLVGLPGSGKSTYAKELKEKIPKVGIFSSDALRKELYNDENDQTHNVEIFAELHKRIKEALLSDKYNLVVYDACNINYKRRMEFLKQINYIKCKKVAVMIATDYETCLEQNAKRKRNVDELIIRKMRENFYVPQTFEGFDEIKLVYSDKNKYKSFSDLKDIEQDNPHHTLSVKKHSLEALAYLKREYSNVSNEIQTAMLLHDIGKLETKTFYDKKGNKSEVAHYYSHENVGAYNCLFMKEMFNCEDILLVCFYIQWHMFGFKILSDKKKRHYNNLLGDNRIRELLIINDSDRNGR